MRKGKALGCGGAKKEKSKNLRGKTKDLILMDDKSFQTTFGMSIDEVIDLPIFESTRNMVEESIKNPGMDLDFDITEIEEE